MRVLRSGRQGRILVFPRSKKNREILGWLGGGIVVVIAGLWAAFVYFFPPKGDGAEGKREVSAIKTSPTTPDEPNQPAN